VAPLPVSAPSVAHAQGRVVDPRDIALKPSDLPPDFFVVPEETGMSTTVEPKGVLLVLTMAQGIAESAATGPSFVKQVIARADEATDLSKLLEQYRNQWIREDGFKPVPGAPNDGGTSSLVKYEKVAGGADAAYYMVGFIKNEMIVYTGWYGLASAVDLPGVLALAGVSSARYDAVLSGGASSTVAAPPAPAPAARSGPVPAADAARVASLPGAPVDARGRPLDGFVNDVVGALDQYWTGGFARNGRAYSTPRLQWVGAEGAVTGCGGRRVTGPGYCGRDGTIYLHVPFFAELWTSQKDFAVVTVIAHEWGHHVQVLLGLSVSGIPQELQADCLAGMFAGHGAAQGYLEPGDLDEAITISWHAGDVAHGSGSQRVEWFLRGYNGSGCGL
jgi:hypothetical protein